jgi:glycolate oxidase FAD binding subunit
MSESALIEYLQERIRTAASSREGLWITGSGSKRRCLPQVTGTPLDVTGYRGIVEYEPAELVITARAGTPLAEVEEALRTEGQMLGFEPPYFGADATLGGSVATGLSGPRRPFAGSVRDFVLGVRCLNGRGEDLSFGGRVMKNVAGYDIARLMTGARGSLGILLEVSCKVLPLPESELTLHATMDMSAALGEMNRLAGLPLSFSGMAWIGDRLYLRLSGTAAGVETAASQLNMQQYEDSDEFWLSLREQQYEFFQDERPLWRFSLPSTAITPDLPGDWLVDWGGSLRWLKTTASPEQICDAARHVGGHALLFRAGSSGGGDSAATDAG